MTTPPFMQIRGAAKHGSDEELLVLRNEIRWLANWAGDVYGELATIWYGAEILIRPAVWDDELSSEMRDVTVKMRLTEDQIKMFTEIFSYDYKDHS
jgi:hypothetical protein